jgi:RNA polymerase sigma-70 factor (ECF subfamily)
MIMTWMRLAVRVPQVSMRPVEVNGGPGALFVDERDRVLAVWAIEIADGVITQVSSIVNPDKLAHLGPVGDFKAVLDSVR